MTHTPGDWFIEAPAKQKKPTAYDHGQELLLCVRPEYGCTFSIATIGGPSNADAYHEMVSNARLIAAAPELLDALRGMVEYVNSLDRIPDLPPAMRAVGTALAAIRSATEAE